METVDVVTAYLYGDLEEDIYMEIPEGIQIPRNMKRPGVKLRKSLYGLRQAGRNWYKRLSDYLIKIGFKAIRTFECVFVRKGSTGIVILAIYVDDLNLFGDNQAIDKTKKQISNEFEIKKLGSTNFSIGTQFERRKIGTFVHQTTYTRRLLDKFNMWNVHPRTIPLEVRSLELDKDIKDIYGPRKENETVLD